MLVAEVVEQGMSDLLGGHSLRFVIFEGANQNHGDSRVVVRLEDFACVVAQIATQFTEIVANFLVCPVFERRTETNANTFAEPSGVDAIFVIRGEGLSH